MSLEFVRKLPTPTEIREQYPLSARATEIKKQRDAEIAKVFTGDSDKFLVIVGPAPQTTKTLFWSTITVWQRLPTKYPTN